MKSLDANGFIILKPHTGCVSTQLLISRPEWFEQGYNIQFGEETQHVDRETYTHITDSAIQQMILSEWMATNSLAGKPAQPGITGMARYFQDARLVPPM